MHVVCVPEESAVLRWGGQKVVIASRPAVCAYSSCVGVAECCFGGHAPGSSHHYRRRLRRAWPGQLLRECLHPVSGPRATCLARECNAGRRRQCLGLPKLPFDSDQVGIALIPLGVLAKYYRRLCSLFIAWPRGSRCE